ncbi:glycoside hydrolase family 95 protein [Sediminibacterium soli]|uniref:glycoside hydrolase family 95 protein n=1 Tax=Sediminibacterium soli TaxID=2698829 RepID=UPI00137A5D32|nr:glycoside hydrolase N-terminal domain-containing protein [Sediminibacterium soli]NCI48171.1 glycoside hydrolase family 95 protein [Sediminibacterium soli]
MKKPQIIYLLLLLMQLLYSRLPAQELKLWYQRPAATWTEALPIGNGRIGAMLFGGVQEDRIQFNEETLWTGAPRSHSRPGAWKYLDTIRHLLFAGDQRSAEALAEKNFMGLKSSEGKKEAWTRDMLSLKGLHGDPSAAHFDDGQWKTMQVPAYDGWESVGFEGLDGAVWLRTYFELPASWLGKDLVLDLNRIRDYDRSYVNGKPVGEQENNEARKYRIPAGQLHAGRNSIAIQVLNYSDKGGITGYKDTTRHIGVYPFGSEQEKLSLNGAWKYLVQDDESPPTAVYQASYQPFGDLLLRFQHTGAVTRYRRELDLHTAIASTAYTADGVDFTRSYLVSQPSQTLAVNLSASRKNSISFEAELNSPHKNFRVTKTGDNTIALSVQVRNGALRGESYLLIRLRGGSLSVAGNRLVVRGADEATLYLTAATNYQNFQSVKADPAAACRQALQNLSGKTYESIRAAHIAEYRKYFNTFSLDLGKSGYEQLPTDQRLAQFAGTGDPSFVALYLQYGRYLLIASSRPGTRPANLQGIWNELLTPPWGSKYTTNINLEMNYWPAEPLNLSPMHEPLFQMIGELAATGKQTALDHYNAPGWVLHHNTDLWRGTAPINAANHGIWVTGGAWLCQHLWEHYLYTQDRQFLRNKAYPLMRDCARFFNAFLVKDPATGWLISTPSNSPEQGGLVAGPAMDHQIIRALFGNVIAAGSILNSDAVFRDTLQKNLAQLAPDQVGRYGQLQEWLRDVDDTTNKHRHISHLWAVYPGKEINWDETPQLMNAARRSLRYRGDAATGWSLGWKINCWARFKDGDHAFRMIQMLISPAKGGAGSYPNLFDAHPPFQIDGNFGGAAGIGELLVQSHTKYIDLLPALPEALPYGKLKGICARGGFVIDMDWDKNKLQKITVTSLAGQPLLLRYRDKVTEIATVKNGRYQFNALLEPVKQITADN